MLEIGKKYLVFFPQGLVLGEILPVQSLLRLTYPWKCFTKLKDIGTEEEKDNVSEHPQD